MIESYFTLALMFMVGITALPVLVSYLWSMELNYREEKESELDGR